MDVRSLRRARQIPPSPRDRRRKGRLAAAGGTGAGDPGGAAQSPWADNPGDYTVNFFLVEPGFSMSGLTVKGTIEYPEGEGGAARFLTPLASLRGRQGWADVFAGTGGAPPNGMRDLYATLSY